MGNHKFRLSDMMPNAWFYKLKDMSKYASAAPHYSNYHKKKDKEKKQKPQQQHQKPTPQKPQQTPSRKSYYVTRTNSTPAHHDPCCPNSVSHSKSSSIDSLFPDPPTQSNKTSTSSSLQFRYLYGMDSVVWTDRSDLAPPPTPSPEERELRSDRALLTESFEEKVSRSSSSSYDQPRNIVIDIDETKQLAAKIENSEDFVTIFDLELRPILTKARPADSKKVKSHKTTTPRYHNSETERRQSVSKGMKMRRANSPRINNGRRKSVSSSTTTTSPGSKKSAIAESLAIVKRSKNPEEDFKQSMVEMIVEHEIRSSKDLEDLLACYLSLNSSEYHDLIISVFKQIWFQLSSSNNRTMRRRPTATATAPFGN